MLLDLSLLPESGLGFEFTIEPSQVELESRFSRMLVPALFVGKVISEEWTAVVKGTSDTKVERQCDRCLTRAEIEVGFTVERTYVKFDDLNAERESKLDTTAVEYSILDSDQLDLLEVFGEHLLIAIPDKYVCKQDCRGLCPECGKNLNTATCDCNKKAIDPRWEALSSLKEDLD